MKARQVIREVLLSLTELLPMARLGTNSQDSAVNTLAAARSAIDRGRRLEHLPFQLILEVSTAHVTAEEIELLQDGSAPAPFSRCMDNGTSWLLHVSAPLPGAAEVTPLGIGLANIFALAVENGFDYVRIDHDAVKLQQLPIYQADEILDEETDISVGTGATIDEAASVHD